MFYSWQCVSIVFKNKTVDFVIKDELVMMQFLACVHPLLFKSTTTDFLRIYNEMKIKMKVSFQAWHDKISYKGVFLRAI